MNWARRYQTRLGALRGLTVEAVTAERVGPQAGSNPGGAFRGSDGVVRYVKFYASVFQPAGEALANHVYNDLGLMAPDAEVFLSPKGSVYASTMVFGIKPYDFKPSQAKEFMQGFAADVLTMNWDVTGLDNDNIGFVSQGFGESCIRIDNGAAFLSRAQGARKDARFLLSVSEWENFILPPDGFYGAIERYGEIAALAGVSSPLRVPDIKGQVRRIIDLRDRFGGWDAYVAKNAPLLEGKDRAAIIEMLDVRTDFMASKVR